MIWSPNAERSDKSPLQGGDLGEGPTLNHYQRCAFDNGDLGEGPTRDTLRPNQPPNKDKRN